MTDTKTDTLKWIELRRITRRLKIRAIVTTLGISSTRLATPVGALFRTVRNVDQDTTDGYDVTVDWLAGATFRVARHVTGVLIPLLPMRRPTCEEDFFSSGEPQLNATEGHNQGEIPVEVRSDTCCWSSTYICDFKVLCVNVKVVA